MEENIFPKWLNHFTGIFFPSTESRTSKQVLPSCLEGKRSPSLGKTEPETDPTHTFWSSTACRDQSTTEQKYLLYIFPTAFVEWLIQIKEQPNPYHTQPRSLCSHKSPWSPQVTEQHPNGGISEIHHLSTASEPATGPRRHQTAFLLPNLDGLHSTHWNRFNKVASSHPSTGFLHLYKYGASKLSYKPNFLVLCRPQWKSQTNSPVCKH